MNYEEEEEGNPLNQAFFEPGPENEGLEEGEMLFGNEGQEEQEGQEGQEDLNETLVSPNAIEIQDEFDESDGEGNISYMGTGGKGRKATRKGRKATRKGRKAIRKTKSRKVIRKVKKTRRIRKARRFNH